MLKPIDQKERDIKIREEIQQWKECRREERNYIAWIAKERRKVFKMRIA